MTKIRNEAHVQIKGFKKYVKEGLLYHYEDNMDFYEAEEQAEEYVLDNADFIKSEFEKGTTVNDTVELIISKYDWEDEDEDEDYAEGGEITIEGNPYNNEDFFIYRNGKEAVSWNVDEMAEDEFFKGIAQLMYDLYNNDKTELGKRLDRISYAEGGEIKTYKFHDFSMVFSDGEKGRELTFWGRGNTPEEAWEDAIQGVMSEDWDFEEKQVLNQWDEDGASSMPKWKINSSTYAEGGEVKTRSGKVLKTDIIHEKKSLGLPYQIVYSKFLRENNISKSSLSFADSSELGTIMLTEWEKEIRTYAEGGEVEAMSEFDILYNGKHIVQINKEDYMDDTYNVSYWLKKKELPSIIVEVLNNRKSVSKSEAEAIYKKLINESSLEIEKFAKGGSTYAEGGEIDWDAFAPACGVGRKTKALTTTQVKEMNAEVDKLKKQFAKDEINWDAFAPACGVGRKTKALTPAEIKAMNSQIDKMKSGSSYAEGGEVEGYNMDEVVKHFVMAGLWASNDDEGEPLEDSYDADDVSKESYEKIAKGAAKFINENKALLKKHNISTESLGHDLFLDSQGHGVGFWDRGYGDDGDTLSKSAAIIFVQDAPYVGDDKKIYFKKGGSIKSKWFSGELSFLNW
jgi:hypothetical protein